jgi:hypothetical protein
VSWDDHHNKSERLAGDAEAANLQGRIEDALRLYRGAAEEESSALDELDNSKPRTMGITAVSAAALWYKSRDWDRAEQIAHTYLAQNLPLFAVQQLRELLQRIWTERAAEAAGIKMVGEGVLISLKGGQVLPGGAPLDLVATKVDEVRALLYRTAEFLAGLPHRVHRQPSPEIQKTCRPWLFQAAPGSYQFAVTLQEPVQLDLFPGRPLTSAEITGKLLDVIRVSAEDPGESLTQVVPSAEYRSTFLKLTRNLAPTGKTLEKLEVRRVTAPGSSPIVLMRGSRDEITKTLRKESGSGSQEDGGPTEVRGVLRAVHLDDDWLQIDVDSDRCVRIEGAKEVVDDVIGPMLNREVLVEVSRTRSGKYRLQDIQLTD